MLKMLRYASKNATPYLDAHLGATEKQIYT